MFLRTLSAIIFLSLICHPAVAEENLVISTGLRPPYTTEEDTGFFNALYREIGRRTALHITLVHLPEERSLALANSGDSDGDGPRPSGVEEQFPHLIRVEEPFILARLAAFTKKGSRIASWEDLNGKNTAFPQGWILPKQFLPDSTRIIRVHTTRHGMAMLDENRVDAVLTIMELGQHEINKHGPANIDPHPPVLRKKALYLYLYLNKRHARLIPVIDAALKDIKKDGTWDKLYRQAITEEHEKEG